MKVILIKDCKDGKANTVIDVAGGYASNFLIRKGLAVPYNKYTKKQLDERLKDLTNTEMETRSDALEIKDKLEKEHLKYNLDAKVDANGNLNVHGAVSTKDISKNLAEKGYKLDKYAIQKIHFVEQGIHEVDVVVYKDIVAKLKVELILNVK